MYKKLSARTKALLSACLENSSDVENENRSSNSIDIIENSPLSNHSKKSERDPDVIENSPINSPIKKLQSALPALLHGNRSKLTELENEKVEPHCSGIESFKDNAYDIGEKSISPPPYSPLTPRPLKSFNACAREKLCMNSSTNDQLTESQLQQNTILNPLSSPLRPMSPETASLYNILTDVFENDCGTPKIALEEKHSTPPDGNNIDFDNDDSVQDPDFVSNGNNTRGSNTSCSSGLSVSLIPILPDTYQTPVDENAHQSSSHSNQIPDEEISEPTKPRSSQGRPKKGRKRKHEHTREERKKRKYENLPYVNSKNKNIDPKPFINFNCYCPKNCQRNISIECRLNEFQKFYSLGSYEAQNMFIAACVKEMPVKRRYVSTTNDDLKKKAFTREYRLKDTQVCKEIFLKTLQTTSKRVNTALSKIRNNCIKDMRGRQGGYNKISEEGQKLIMEVIQKLPKYVSHYRREKCNDANFLRPDMTFSKIYELYKQEAILTGQKILSFSKVKSVFLKNFNLRTKPLKKDCCNKCDFFATKIKQGSEEERALMKDAHRQHLEKSNKLQNQLKHDMKLAQDDPNTETITFDLQKTLPLPRIPTNVVFYKRQLWVYNLGIHCGSNDQAYCNVWVEGEAGRGSQEVGSCLIKHINEKLGDDVKNLILWSDSCGGQNRNIKLTLMLKALLHDHPTLQTIRLRFLESGHSFLPNDNDFGRIECALKLQQRLYTPEDYMQIMRNCRKSKPMHVTRMKKEEFLSSSNLEKKITNRKKALDGSKVSWLNAKELLIRKNEEFSLFMRSNLDEDFVEINLKKNPRGNNISSLCSILMYPLWPNGKCIPEAKLNDLKSLLHLIPADAQDFYKKLKGDITIIDDVDGFSGDIDFDLEVDETISTE